MKGSYFFLSSANESKVVAVKFFPDLKMLVNDLEKDRSPSPTVNI